MKFNPDAARAECIRIAHLDKLGKDEYMTSRWDAHGAFIAGASWQYKQMIEEYNKLKVLYDELQRGNMDGSI